MNQVLWENCVEFHGHECPGLAIGFRACEIAKEEIGLTFLPDEDLVCITEIDSCPIDAIKFIAKCSAEKGNLLINKTGNAAFSFLNKDTGENIKLVLHPTNKDMDKETAKRFILEAPADQVFGIIKGI